MKYNGEDIFELEELEVREFENDVDEEDVGRVESWVGVVVVEEVWGNDVSMVYGDVLIVLDIGGLWFLDVKFDINNIGD